MSWVSCCIPPRKTPDLVELEDPQLWQCPVCGQWWLIYKYRSPERISHIDVILFYHNQWRHWHKAHKGDKRERDRID